MINRVNCSSCNKEIFLAEAKKVKKKRLCEDCYIYYLLDLRYTRKRQFFISFVLYFLPSLFIYLIAFEVSPIIDYSNEYMTINYIFLLITFIGAIYFTRHGFEVGDPDTYSYYEGDVYGDTVKIVEKTEESYSIEQKFKILINIGIFIIGFLGIIFLGILVIWVKLFLWIKVAKKLSKYDLDSDVNADEDNHHNHDEHTISTKKIKSYKGLIAQKALNPEVKSVSVIEGVEVEHIGYIFHNDILYGAIGTEKENDVFVTMTTYFLKLFPKNNAYEIIELNSELYQTLYDELYETSDSEEDSDNDKLNEYPYNEIEKIFDDDYEGTVSLYNHKHQMITYNRLAYISKDNAFYVCLEPVNKEDCPRPYAVYYVSKDQNDDLIVSETLDHDVLEWVHKRYLKLLEEHQ